MSQYNITVNYAVGGGTFVSASSYLDRSTVSRLDVTDQFAALLPGLPISNQSTTLQREFTEELRYASPADRALTYLVGVFYSHLDRTFTQVLPAANADALFNDIGLDYGLPNTLYLAQHDVLFKETAAFGEGTLRLTNQLAFTAGLRWFHEGLDGTGFANGALNGGLTQDVASGSDNGVLPKFTLSDQLNPHDLIYATASKGYRRGGVNPTIPSQIASCQQDLEQIGLTSAPETFKADTVWNYELGAKTQWLDNRLVFNADAYYLDWKGLPGTKILNCGFAFTKNAGAARVTGAEAELDAKVSRNFAFMSTFAFTNAVLTQDFPDLGAVSGQRAPGVPRFTWSAVAQYEHPISSETEGFANLEYQHVGASYNNFDPASSQHLDQYDMFNLSAGLKGSRWEGALFVNNLTNRLAIVNAYDTPFANFVVRTRPRTIGIRGMLSF